MPKQLVEYSYKYNEYDKPTNDLVKLCPSISIPWRVGELSKRSNYIAYPTPCVHNRHDWHYAYLEHLLAMYDIVANTIDEKYPRNRIVWGENKKIFHNLSRLIYHCSSKHIDYYL